MELLFFGVYLNPHRKSAGSGPVLKTQTQFGLCLRERCLHPAGGQRLSVEPGQGKVSLEPGVETELEMPPANVELL